MKSQKILSAALSILLSVNLYYLAFAQEEEKTREKPRISSVTKKIEGVVSAVNKNGIAVVYNRNPVKGLEEEMFVPLNNSIRLAHKKKLEEIGIGDTVSVKYEEITREAKEGPVKTFEGITGTFLKPAPKKP